MLIAAFFFFFFFNFNLFQWIFVQYEWKQNWNSDRNEHSDDRRDKITLQMYKSRAQSFCITCKAFCNTSAARSASDAPGEGEHSQQHCGDRCTLTAALASWAHQHGWGSNGQGSRQMPEGRERERKGCSCNLPHPLLPLQTVCFFYGGRCCAALPSLDFKRFVRKQGMTPTLRLSSTFRCWKSLSQAENPATGRPHPKHLLPTVAGHGQGEQRSRRMFGSPPSH